MFRINSSRVVWKLSFGTNAFHYFTNLWFFPCFSNPRQINVLKTKKKLAWIISFWAVDIWKLHIYAYMQKVRSTNKIKRVSLPVGTAAIFTLLACPGESNQIDNNPWLAMKNHLGYNRINNSYLKSTLSSISVSNIYCKHFNFKYSIQNFKHIFLVFIKYTNKQVWILLL